MATTTGRVFCILYIKCKQMYGLLSYSYWQGFFALVTCCTLSEAKILPLKMVLLSLRVYYVSVSSYKDCYPTTVCKNFLVNFSGFTYYDRKQVYSLLPHHYSKGVFTQVYCSVTSSRSKMLLT